MNKWIELLENNTAINCKTLTEAKEFLNICDRLGYKWIFGGKALKHNINKIYNVYNEKTVFYLVYDNYDSDNHLEKYKLHFCDIEYIKTICYFRVVDFSELQETKTISNEINLISNIDDYVLPSRKEFVMDRIKHIIALEQVHNMICPDYVPNWHDHTETKYYVQFDYCLNKKCFNYTCHDCCEDLTNIYFPTREIAIQACKMLNEMFGFPDNLFK